MDDDPNPPAEITTHPDLDGLPISQAMIERIEEITGADGEFDVDEALPIVIAAIVALERALREG